MRRAAAVLLAGVAGITAAAQPPERAFKREIEAVQIDVRVIDRDGSFVRGLTKDDLTLIEDGREQSITTFDLVEIPIVAAPAGPIVDPDVASNAAGDTGRVYLIVLDDLHTHPLRSTTVRELAREFIERNLGPHDRAAVIATSARRELATELTGNRGRLLASVSRFEGGFSAGARCGGDGQPCLADEHLTMRYLTRLSTWLSGLDGRRKTLLFISEGFDSGISDAFTPAASLTSIFDNLSNLNDAASDIREVISAAARSNVSIFAIDPRGLPGSPSTTIRPVTTLVDDDEGKAVIARQGLEILAKETGGFALVRSNAFSDAFARLVRESSSYYLLGYTSTNTAHDGKFRRVQVRATHPGLTVRARSGYVARNDKPSKPAASSSQLPPALVEAIESPVQIAGVPLTVSAVPFRGVKSRAAVTVVVEARSGALPLSLFVAAADPDGAIKGEEHGTLDLKASPAPAPSGDRVVRLVSRLNLPPGRYQLRAAGQDRAGSIGSVHFDLDVPDFSKGPIAMSGLLLASAEAAGAPTGGTDRSWKERLTDPPTTVRQFAAGDRVSLFTEIYDNDAKAGEPIDVTTSIRSESGSTVFTRRERLSKHGGNSRAITYPFSQTLPLIGLPPGRYLLNVDARRAAGAAHQAARQIPISVR